MDEQTAIEFEVLQIALDQIKSGLPLSDMYAAGMDPEQIRADLIQSFNEVLNHVL